MINRDVLLTEYQVCQHYNSSSAQTYWTITGIFIGFSSVLLGGLLYGVLSNNLLFQAILHVVMQKDLQTLAQKMAVDIPVIVMQVKVAASVVLVLSAAIISVYYFLLRWLKRVQFLQQRHFERIHELELKLRMQSSIRIHAIDRWNSWKDIDEKELECKDRNIKERIEELRLGNWCDILRNNEEYERPSRTLHYKGIIFTLFGLWIILALTAIFLLKEAYVFI